MATTCPLPTELPPRELQQAHKQRTLAQVVTIEGIGLFTGQETSLTIHPAPANSGILLSRKDQPSGAPFPAKLEHVVGTPRCTILGNGQYTIHTVEHVLAVLHALGIDNALLELSGPEIPIMDGSGVLFVEAIERVGLQLQEEEREIFTIERPVSWTKGDVHLVALPAENFRLSYTLHFPDSFILGSQFYSLEVNPENFIDEIAPCRTFCFYEEISPLIESGLIKGGGLENAVVINHEGVVNEGGFRFDDECVRHKLLDLVGDLSLIGKRLGVHVIAIRSGHASNVAFAKELQDHLVEKKNEGAREL